MKIKIIFFLLIFISFQSDAQEKGMKFFEGSWEEILYQSNVENKYIFVDAYTTWCGPCKMMKNKIFPLEEVGKFYNENFISAAWDMEKGDGVEFAKIYDVHSYPTYLFFDPSGNLVHRSGGYKPADNFIVDGVNALDPNNQFYSLKKKFDAGEKNPEFLYKFTSAANVANVNEDEATKAYLITQNEEDLLSDKNWKFMKAYLNDINSREFAFLIKNQDKFKEKYGAEEVSNKISGISFRSVMSAAKKKDEEAFNKIKKIISENTVPKEAEKLNFNVDLTFYSITGNWTKYAEIAIQQADKYAIDNANQLNSICWNFYENIDDKSMLEKATQWIKKSIQIENKYYNNDTYVALLYKLGKKEEALNIGEKTRALAKEENEDFSSTEKIIEKIKQLK